MEITVRDNKYRGQACPECHSSIKYKINNACVHCTNQRSLQLQYKKEYNRDPREVERLRKRAEAILDQKALERELSLFGGED